MACGYWLLKTPRADHQIVHSGLTTMPKKKMKHYEDLSLNIETIPRSRDHEKGADNGHKASGKFQPKPADTVQALALRNSDDGPRRRSTLPHGAFDRKADAFEGAEITACNDFSPPWPR
jgi:hypothetical protein